MSEKELQLIRPQVAKHEALFIKYVRRYGTEMVKKVLTTGQCGPMRLKIMNNKKDRYQMIQLLGL